MTHRPRPDDRPRHEVLPLVGAMMTGLIKATEGDGFTLLPLVGAMMTQW